jgi:putative NADPH-quinone reductase
MKNILVINGHPDKESYCDALSQSYINGGKTSQNKIDIINIYDLNFDPNLKHGYRQRVDLEPDLKDAISKILKADHLVWVFPMWWNSYPAQMKGFIDRTFLPGITYQPIEGKSFPKKLLKGKTARIILTSDTPQWYDTFIMKRPLIKQFKKATLEFCGVSPVKVSYVSPIKTSSLKFRQKWLDKASDLGKFGK